MAMKAHEVTQGAEALAGCLNLLAGLVPPDPAVKLPDAATLASSLDSALRFLERIQGTDAACTQAGSRMLKLAPALQRIRDLMESGSTPSAPELITLAREAIGVFDNSISTVH